MSKLRIKSMLHNEADILEAEDEELKEVITPAVDNIVEPKLVNKPNIYSVPNINISNYDISDKLKEILEVIKRGDFLFVENTHTMYLCNQPKTEEPTTYTWYFVGILVATESDNPISQTIIFECRKSDNRWTKDDISRFMISYDVSENVLSDVNEGYIYPQGVIAYDEQEWVTLGLFKVTVNNFFGEQHDGSLIANLYVDCSNKGEYDVDSMSDRIFVASVYTEGDSPAGIATFQLWRQNNAWSIGNIVAFLQTGFTRNTVDTATVASVSYGGSGPCVVVQKY